MLYAVCFAYLLFQTEAHSLDSLCRQTQTLAAGLVAPGAWQASSAEVACNMFIKQAAILPEQLRLLVQVIH